MDNAGNNVPFDDEDNFDGNSGSGDTDAHGESDNEALDARIPETSKHPTSSAPGFQITASPIFVVNLAISTFGFQSFLK